MTSSKEGVGSVEAEEGEAPKAGQAAVGSAEPTGRGAFEPARPGEPDESAEPADGGFFATLRSDDDQDDERGENGEAADEAEPGRPRRPDVSGGIGCTALLLPLLAVAGAVLCFFAGVLSTATGCGANGSALCSPNGPWYAFALPVFVSPLVAAVSAIGAVNVRRHRSTWLAVGYGIVFISIIVGLATASTGSS
jgi:hypothetical protein